MRRSKRRRFLDLCFTPEYAAEVTLQPIRRYGFDAAILFADILLLPQALGPKLWFETGEGPRMETTTTPDQVAALKPTEAIHDTLSPIYETVRILAALAMGAVRGLRIHGARLAPAAAETAWDVAARRLVDDDPAAAAAVLSDMSATTAREHAIRALTEMRRCAAQTGKLVIIETLGTCPRFEESSVPSETCSR